jgi:hypothetical protein
MRSIPLYLALGVQIFLANARSRECGAVAYDESYQLVEQVGGHPPIRLLE